MKLSPPRSDSITWITVCFEGGLAVVALAVGWLFAFSPIQNLRLTADDWWRVLLLGCAGSVPLFAGLLVIQTARATPMVRLRETAATLLKRLLGRCTLAELAVISFFAGVGEEILFRGLLQEGLATAIGPPVGILVGLIVASIIFGAAHAVTPTYALLATAAGAYLGLLLIYSDNLVVPILAHALYDFGALVYLLRWPTSKSQGEMSP